MTPLPESLQEVIPGLYRWTAGRDPAAASAHALVSEDAAVLIDPLPLELAQLQRFVRIQAIVLSAARHQRAAWQLREETDAAVYAPEGAEGLAQEPDERYEGGDSLPGGLISFHTPGPSAESCALWLPRQGGVVFLSDLLVNDGSGPPRFPPARLLAEPERARASVRRIFERLPVEVLCFDFGSPIVGGGLQALKDALVSDPEYPPEHPWI